MPSAEYRRRYPERVREYARRDNAKRGAAKRQWERDNRAACPTCGEPMRAGSRSPSRTPGECRRCYDRSCERRREEIIALRLEGLQPREIAERLEVSRHAVATVLYRARKAGRDIPPADRGRPPDA